VKCAHGECDEKAIAKGWCGKHYARVRRHGSPDVVLRVTKLVKRGPNKRAAIDCSVDECDQTAKKRGWCNKHYLRWRKYGDPLITKHEVSRDGPVATFHAHVERRGPDECWPWKRPPNKAGYGQVQWLDGKVWYAHRVAYVLAYGEIPVSEDPGDPIELDHVCHDHRTCPETDRCPHRLCCNPAHLVAKPRSENTGRTMFWQRCPPGCACGRHENHGNGRTSGGVRKCLPGCTCGKHRSHSGPASGSVKCQPGCTCGKHYGRIYAP
jgi:homing endonuclease-like protein